MIIDVRNWGVQICAWVERSGSLAVGCVRCVPTEVAIEQIHSQGSW